MGIHDMKGFMRRASGLLVPDNDLLNQVIGLGRYSGQIIRAGEVIDEFDCKNLVVNQGLNYMLGAALGAQTVVTTWYLGLGTTNYASVAGDTAATIASSF